MNRKSLTDEELERLTAEDFVRLKLTAEERLRLRAINAARTVDRTERAARWRSEQKLLLMELQAIGLKINDLSDLINTSDEYRVAVPILLRHLPMPYSDVTKETIARALARPYPEVRAGWSVLVSEFMKAPVGWGIKGPGDTKAFKLGAKDGLACALSAAVTDATMDELIELARDTSLGSCRILLMIGLRNSKSDSAIQAMQELASDPDLKKAIESGRKQR